MWPSTLYEVGGMGRHHPFVLLMGLGERYTYKHCDRCVALHSHAEPYMRQHGLAEGKYVNIQNGVVEEEWEHPQPLPEEHKAFFEEVRGKFIVGYFGGHAVSNALDYMLDAAKAMQEENPLVRSVLTIGPEGCPESLPEGWLEQRRGARIYVSLDKDIMARDWARTDWSQGTHTLEQVKEMLTCIMEGAEVAAVDICGEISPSKGGTPEDLRINRETNIELYTHIIKHL
jgi:hypothetical protein